MPARNLDVNPANCLAGMTLNDGWHVVELIKRPPQSTGGHFSVGYKVRRNEVEAYLKALDFKAAFQSPDVARSLEAMVSAYNFERNLLAKCKERRMRYVVSPVADGSIDVPGLSSFNKVLYIIFELADGDIRNIMSKMQTFDLAWCLRSLHNIAAGLQQLHQGGIAHQDLKPSNVLIFKVNTSKISDLGRASDKTIPFTTDELQIPGDINYAAPELSYGYRFTNEFEFRYAADVYHFGSLFFFYFSGLSATQALNAKFRRIVGERNTNSNFEVDLPYLQRAFAEALCDLEKDIRVITEDYALEIIDMVIGLCDPDPRRRGHPKNILNKFNQYGMHRYISKLDLLARKVELEL